MVLKYIWSACHKIKDEEEPTVIKKNKIEKQIRYKTL